MNDFALPINLQTWIEKNKDALKPPVCNKQVFKENGFIIMVVGGPNTRKDYHYNEGAEFFYQIKGDMVLKLMQAHEVTDITISEGELFLLPPKVPHSPQRYENTVGLVIERSRANTEKDGLQWYCDECQSLLYEEYFHLKNIELDMPPVFDRFYQDPNNLYCKQCGYQMPLPTKQTGVAVEN